MHTNLFCSEGTVHRPHFCRWQLRPMFIKSRIVICQLWKPQHTYVKRAVRLRTLRWIGHSRSFQQSWGLRPRSYDKTDLRPASVLVLVLYFWFWSWSWSCSFGLILLPFGLASNTVVPDRRCVTWQCWNVINTCIFSCSKCRNSAKRNWSSYHFLTFSAQLFFDNKRACCNRRVFLLCSLAVA